MLSESCMRVQSLDVDGYWQFTGALVSIDGLKVVICCRAFIFLTASKLQT
jgi:hypothetical protein